MRKGIKSGQVGLILLVVMGLVVGLTLSIAGRSLSDNVLSRQEKENTSAFALAEAGVERALRDLAGGSTSTSNVTSSDGGLVTGSYNGAAVGTFEMYLREGEGVEVDITSVPVGGNISLIWTRKMSPQENPGTCTEGSGTMPAAMGITVIDSASQVRRAYYNPSNCNIPANSFLSASNSSSSDYQSQTSITRLTNELTMRVVPIYNAATLKITNGSLTQAMFSVDSTAGSADSNKEIEVRKSRESAGSIFDYALFSGSTIE